MLQRLRFGGAVCFQPAACACDVRCGQRGEIGEGAQQGDAEAHRPVGIEGHREAEPGFGKREQRRYEQSAPESGGHALRRGRRSDHQREYQQHADDLRACRYRECHDREECGGDEAQRHAFGFRQFGLQAGEDQGPHDGGERSQRDHTEHGQRRDHGVVDRQNVTEQQRGRLRRERRVVVQKQQSETERQRQDHADCDVAVADALAERAHHDARGERKGEQAPQRRQPDQTGAGRAGKSNMG